MLCSLTTYEASPGHWPLHITMRPRSGVTVYTETCKYVYFIGIVSMNYCMDFRRATKADEGEFTLPVSS